MNRIIYDRFLEKLKKVDIQAYAFMNEGRPKDFKNNVLFVMFSKDKKFHKNRAENKKQIIEKVLSGVLKEKVQVEFYIKGERLKEIAKMFNGDIIKVDENILKEFGEKCK